MPSKSPNHLLLLLLVSVILSGADGRRSAGHRDVGVVLDEETVHIWPLPKNFTRGNQTLSVDPTLTLQFQGTGESASILSEAFERYKDLIFNQGGGHVVSRSSLQYDVGKISVIVDSDNITLQFGVDESYTLYVAAASPLSIIAETRIEANTIFGALRGLENVLHWHIIDEESFPLEVPSYPDLWKGAYTKWERYTVEDARDVVEHPHYGRN